MTLRLGAAADASLSASITYEALSVQGSVNTGLDGGYTLIKPYPQNKPVGEMVTDFLKQIRMPASASDALAEGELIAYELEAIFAWPHPFLPGTICRAHIHSNSAISS